MHLFNIDQNLWLKAYPALAANAALLVYALVKKPRLKTYLIVFSLTTLADILVASKLVPIANANAQTLVEYVFVLIGDLRFILILAFLIYAKKNLSDFAAFRITGDVVRPAFIFTLFPTLLVSALNYLEPNLLQSSRHKFLAYEVAFFVLTFLWNYVVLPQKNLASAEYNFIKRISIPVFIYYGLWASADYLILRGNVYGYALRVVPNLVYYCLFLPWIALSFERKNAFS